MLIFRQNLSNIMIEPLLVQKQNTEPHAAAAFRCQKYNGCGIFVSTRLHNYFFIECTKIAWWLPDDWLTTKVTSIWRLLIWKFGTLLCNFQKNSTGLLLIAKAAKLILYKIKNKCIIISTIKDDILTSVTSKINSKPQRYQKWPNGGFQEYHFWNQSKILRKMSYHLAL